MGRLRAVNHFNPGGLMWTGWVNNIWIYLACHCHRFDSAGKTNGSQLLEMPRAHSAADSTKSGCRRAGLLHFGTFADWSKGLTGTPGSSVKQGNGKFCICNGITLAMCRLGGSWIKRNFAETRQERTQEEMQNSHGLATIRSITYFND